MDLEHSRLSRGRFTALAVGLLMLVAAFHLYRLFDFRIFFDASHRLLAGKDLYPTRAQLYAPTRDYYVLPPLVAFLSVPFSLLPFALAGSLYALSMIAALAASLRICGVTDKSCYIALLLSMPVLQTIGLGTIEPLLVLALALAWRYRDRKLLGSVPLGFAIAAKLFLWPLLLWLLFTGRIRRSFETVAAALVAILLPWAVIGFHQFTWYPHVLELLVKTEQATGWGLPSSTLFGATVVAADAIACVIVFAVSRSADGDRKAFTAAVLACLLLSPLVWLHYYVVLVVPIALESRRFSWLWVVPALAIWPYTDSHELPGVKLYAYVLVAIVALSTLLPDPGDLLALVRLRGRRPALLGQARRLDSSPAQAAP
jgi:alpha-1,2-mannosyltransferase